MAFVDTLTCGLSAFLMLWLALTTAPGSRTGRGVMGDRLEIGLADRDQEVDLALRFVIGGRPPIHPGELARASGGTAFVTDPADGSRDYTVVFTGDYAPGPDDLVVVYLNDIGAGAPEAETRIAARIVGKGGERSPRQTLSVAGGRFGLAVRLADLIDDIAPAWREYP